MGEADVPVGHVFISYVREDAHHADLLQRALESAGVRVWRDTADLWPGEDWRAKIRHEITSKALVFVACFSHQGLAREVSYQNEELALAVEQMRLRRLDRPWLIPVRFDDCDIPEMSVGGGRTLATIQRADLFGDRAGDAMQRLVAAVQRILGRNASGPRPGRPLSEVSDPIQFEVHPSIDAGASGLPALPIYVPREHDQVLGAMVARAVSGRSGFAILVGGSSVGKTRACWEALNPLRDCPEEWRLWHPIDPARPDAALADLARIGPRTVVWLNETQHYLWTFDPAVGEKVAAGLRELLRAPERGPVLVLGTLWPAYWDILTAFPDPGEPDPHAQSRDLLKGACIRVPEAFTSADLRVVVRRANLDPRLAEARRGAPSGRLTQYLAGGPALIERYDHSGPGARAILDAAIDSRRLGLGPLLPGQLLWDAAYFYLDAEQRELLADDWLQQAFDYVTDPRPCRGARPPLTCVPPPPGTAPASVGQEAEYHLADYLEQHGTWKRRMLDPPREIWGIANRYATRPSNMYCVKCRARRPAAYTVTGTRGRKHVQLRGRCSVCGTFMYKLADAEPVE